MAQYKVRSGFSLDLGSGESASQGQVIELTEEKAKNFAHQIELYTPVITKKEPK